MSRFTLQKQDVAPRKPALLVYGEPGIGKTTFGAAAPNVVFVCAEDGAAGLDVVRLPNVGKCETWDEVIKSIDVITTEPHDFEWVVVDTLSAAEQLCADMVCERDFNGRWNPVKSGGPAFNAYGAGDKTVGQEMKALIAKLDALRQRRDMGVILLAHVDMRRQANALGDDYQKFCGAMNKYSWEQIRGWADQVAYAGREVKASHREGERRAKAYAVGTERWLIFEGGPGRDAKARAGYDMPERILLDWDEYEAAGVGDRDAALTEQALSLLGEADEDTRGVVAMRLDGGKISKDAVKAMGRRRLEALNNWLLSRRKAD